MLLSDLGILDFLEYPPTLLPPPFTEPIESACDLEEGVIGLDICVGRCEDGVVGLYVIVGMFVVDEDAAAMIGLLGDGVMARYVVV